MRWRLDGIGIFQRGRIVSVEIETRGRSYSIPGGFGLGRLKSGNGRCEMTKVDLSQTEILKLPLEIRRRILADGALDKEMEGVLSNLFDSTEGQWSTCEWEYNDEHGRWDTECDDVIVLHGDESPFENGFKFCPYCGKPCRDV